MSPDYLNLSLGHDGPTRAQKQRLEVSQGMKLETEIRGSPGTRDLLTETQNLSLNTVQTRLLLVQGLNENSLWNGKNVCYMKCDWNLKILSKTLLEIECLFE